MNFEHVIPDDISRKSLSNQGVTMLRDEPQLWVRGTMLDGNKSTKWENIGITLATGEKDKSVMYLVVSYQDERIAIPFVLKWEVKDEGVSVVMPMQSYINEMMNQHFQSVVNEVKPYTDEEE